MSTNIEDFKQRLTRAETNINQNTALILQLMNGTITPGGGGGSGIGLSNNFGDNELLGITQKKLTEAFNAVYTVDEGMLAEHTYKTVILDPNTDSHGVCRITQSMMSSAHTKYIIKYNYDVQENITMPQDCILMIDGGNLYSSTGIKTITGVQNSYDNYDTLLITVIPYDQCVDTDSVTLTRFTENSEIGTIVPSKIPSQSIDTTKLTNGAVTEPILANSAVTEDKIASNAITENKIAGNSITSSKIADGAINSNKIATDAVEESNIAGNAISSGKIKNGAITAAKLDRDSVTTTKIEDEAVVTSKIDYGAVTKEKLSTDVKSRIDNTYTKSEVYTKNQTYNKEEVYTKEEVGNIVSVTDPSEVIVLTVEEGETAADVLAAVPGGIDPVTGVDIRCNKLYRLRNDDNTAYSEYAYDGTKWELLANKDYGIDDEPIEGSTNLISSKGVAKVAGAYTPINNEAIYAITDAEGKTLLALNKDGSAFIPGLPQQRGVSYLDMVQMTLDPDGKIVSYRLKDGTLVEPKIEVGDLILGSAAAASIKDAIGGGGAGEAVVDYEGWNIPQTEGEETALKKSDSLTQIKWIPLHDVPTRYVYDTSNAHQYFSANVEVTGIPYSQSSNINKIVGYDVSLETFMTAVHNPYSLLYTEILCKKHDGSNPDSYSADTGTIGGRRKSAYGKTNYSGINKYAGPYYGNVCSTFTSYCSGLPDDFRTVDSVTLNKIDKLFGKIFPQSAQGVKTGDVIYQSGHTRLIKEVQRDENFTVINVLISEQGHTYYADETLNSAEEFDAKLNSITDGIKPTVYRNTKIYANTEMFEFDATKYVYNDNICTFAGNKACFKKGDKIYIHCFNCLGNGGYTFMELYKDDVLIDTIAIEDTSSATNPTVYPVNKCINTWNPDKQIPDYREIGVTAGTSASHYVVNLTRKNLNYGNYKARLRVGNTDTYSDFTYFQIVDAVVSYFYVPENIDPLTGNVIPTDTVTINFSSRNGIPTVIKIVQYYENAPDEDKPATNGVPRGYYLIKPDDYVVDDNGAHGSVTLSADYFLAQNREVSNTMVSGGQYYLKVFFKTDWGRVTNDPQVISFTFNYN